MNELNDIVHALSLLHDLEGVAFIRQLKVITERREFKPLATNPQILTTGGMSSEDYMAQLSVALQAVEHGYTVYILPNPQGIRTADFIFVRKGIYRMFDLKTIIGQNSVSNRLKESLGQTNRVLLNLRCDYNVRRLTSEVRHYFEMSNDVQEVLLFRGKKGISIKRNIALSRGFLQMMMNSFR
ncbi:MAG: hypothetical protein IJT75_04260 [Bacteroidaceae bacterium]|nr:hypothetical protein [Bacteroidaceae bacterium]